MILKTAKTLKAAAIGLTLLLGMGTVQAAPILDHDYGVLGVGSNSFSLFLPDNDPNVRWFGFTLSTTSLVNLTTIGSNEDTELALYTESGALLGQNDDCGLQLYSCLDFPSLVAGNYIAGVADFNAFFEDDFIIPVSTGDSDEQITLTVTARALAAVPVPAAVWLFGSALMGFVGFSRRTSIKT